MIAKRGMLVLLIVTLWAGVARAVEVQQVYWGFSDHVAPNRFNLISVKLINPESEAYDGVVRLSRSGGLASVGAPIVERVFLLPGTSRWVQFHVFEPGSASDWTLSSSRGSTRIQPAAIQTRQHVFLEAKAEAFRRVTGLPTFDAQLFPTTVGATDALASVVLDGDPGWDEPRVRAFRHWVWAGGTVHVLQSAAGFERFSGGLAFLNAPQDEYRWGGGRVLRHRMTRADVNRDWIVRQGLTPPSRDRAGDAAAIARQQRFALSNGVEIITRRLRDLVTPEHPWAAIYIMSFAFLVIVGPVHYLLSRRRLSYVGSLGSLLAVVGLFSWLFYAVGKRGYDEVAVVHAVSVARPVDNAGAWDVASYANVFKTDGGRYAFRHGDGYSIYSTGQQQERVSGFIVNGLNGAFTADIPLFSNRSFVARAVRTGPAPDVSVAEWEAGGDPSDDRLDLVVNLPEAITADLRAAWAVHGDQMVQLAPAGGGRYRAGQALWQPHDAMLNLDSVREYYDVWRFTDTDATSLDEVARDLAHTLIADRLGLLERDPEGSLTPAGQARVFVLAGAPQSFDIASSDQDPVHHVVLYDLWIEAPAVGQQKGADDR